MKAEALKPDARGAGVTQPAYVNALVRDLAGISGEVRFDAGSRALYATDGSNYRQVPIGVVLPKSLEDVVTTVAACRKYGAPLLSRGGGTSLAGQCCNVAVVMDFSKYLHNIVELDPANKRARVEPGLILDDLRDAAEKHTLTFAPDPSTHTHNTLGGMIGNNSCGVHSVMGGKTSENIEELEILTYDGLRMRVGATSDAQLERFIREGGRRGEIYAALKTLRDKYAELIRSRYPKIPRRVSGYNLDELLPENGFNVARALVGSEGTCVTILEATTRLVYSPPVRSLLVLGYIDVFSAADHVMDALAAGPVGLEGLGEELVSDMKAIGLHPDDLELLPKGGGWLLVEFGGETKDESDDKAHKLMEQLKGREDAPLDMKLYDDKSKEELIWKVRQSGLGATAHVPNKQITWEGWEDAAVPPEKLGPYLRDFRALLKRYSYKGDLYGHFGQGCVHTRIDFDLETQPGIDKFHRFLGDAADLVVSYGGSLSGEHGDGQSKAEFLGRMFGAELVQAFGEFKRIWDPGCHMNPGKIVDPYLPTENLRIGTGYAPSRSQTHFHFPKDDHNFGRTILRCVGIGNCRRTHHDTMCPSFMATREEKYSTRGRARLLFEMLKGEVITGGWRDENVRDALDLCLACKGCKGDCPVNVDMASYKAEFLSHYYQGHLRRRAAYTMGLIHVWARLAAHLPRTVNYFTHSSLWSPLLKKLGGIAPQREMPEFAKQTFRDWFARRSEGKSDGLRVILWPDTFTNHFLPETAIAAVEVLEHAGCTVVLPKQPLCCGRPLYDWGMLDRATELWKRNLAMLHEDIRAGTPIVGLEPACVAAFRDELGNLFPHDEDAKRLCKQTHTLAEFLQKNAYVPNRLAAKAIVHMHCNHRAVMGKEADCHVFEQLGLDYELLDSGCCGMAGSFGFETHKYALSQTIGERVLLPAVRRTGADTLLIADGFSCREQVRQATGRMPLHLAQVLQRAIHDGTAPAAPAPQRAPD
ncbi:FAD-linked oxidase C-terminal domain-containing protein [Rhodanobacter sp. 7MK24]|uniref:FAD-binding and (Fe-S)-binding domain-containing protein n=1 Tax=Rhodanobacter sp. 7MK24 TaxID=2775922 RepID=UPI0031BB0F55